MADTQICVLGESWKLRAAEPQVSFDTPSDDCICVISKTRVPRFILQTFGAEKRVVRSYKATTRLLASLDFVGLDPDSEYETASYNATTYTDQNGNVVFQGQETKVPTYLPESQMPGVSNFKFS
jgi:hypothetical protein